MKPPTSMRALKKLAYHLRHKYGMKQEDAMEEAAWRAGYNSHREARDALGSKQAGQGSDDDAVSE